MAIGATEWTPGPWCINKYRSIGAGEHGTEPVIAIIEPFYGSDRNLGDSSANARLIAAAPALYEALTDAIAGLRYVREHYHDERTASGDLYGIGFDRVEQKAAAALAAARGETP